MCEVWSGGGLGFCGFGGLEFRPLRAQPQLLFEAWTLSGSLAEGGSVLPILTFEAGLLQSQPETAQAYFFLSAAQALQSFLEAGRSRIREALAQFLP